MRALTDRWLRYDDAAAHLCGSRRWLETQVAEGRVPFIRRGRTVLFDRESLDEWMKNQEVPAQVVGIGRRGR